MGCLQFVLSSWMVTGRFDGELQQQLDLFQFLEAVKLEQPPLNRGGH